VASAAEIYIHAGVPEYEHFSAAVECGKDNMPGLWTYGVQAQITAFVGDRYSNPVAEGTIVYFESEAGIIGASETPTDQFAQATTWLETAGPAPWDTAWEVPYTRYDRMLHNDVILDRGPWDYPYGEFWTYGVGTVEDPQVTLGFPLTQSDRDQWNTQTGGTPDHPWLGHFHVPNPMDGVVTVIYITLGEEYFFDANSNGMYDLGEYFIDLPEPYVDANDNGQWDSGERYRDNPPYIAGNNMGQYDGPNGEWDGIENPAGYGNGPISIWKSERFVFSGEPSDSISWKVRGDYQQCLTGALVNTIETPAGPVAAPDTCWVNNAELVWADWDDADGDGSYWETDATFTATPGFKVGGTIGPGCISMIAVMCDRYHNPVSPVNIPEFEIDVTGPIVANPDEIENLGGGGGEFDCHYHFSVCDSDAADTDPAGGATVIFKAGVYAIQASGTGD